MTKQYTKLLEFDNVKLEFEDDAIEAIADEAMSRKSGARGLRSIVESVMMEVMYEIPSIDNVEKCIITKDSVKGEGKPVLVYKEEK